MQGFVPMNTTHAEEDGRVLGEPTDEKAANRNKKLACHLNTAMWTRGFAVINKPN